MDIHKALSGRTEKTPTIVLAHQPRAAAEAIHWNDVKLVLSRHTHAGQILPLMLPMYILSLQDYMNHCLEHNMLVLVHIIICYHIVIIDLKLLT